MSTPMQLQTQSQKRGLDASSIAAATSAVTVLLTNELTAGLDEVIADLRRTTGKAISRSAMIRAFTAALLPYRGYWIK
jgi:hypothetical protein